MSGVRCMDCRADLVDDGPCPCCTRSVSPREAHAQSRAVHWLRVRTTRGLVLVRLTDEDLRGGAVTIDLREVS